ncbi:Ribosomal protein L7/L12 domain protein [Theileria parva strain Muguga]|uniref:Large ribosomal subunit protein bL12 oligomerization domain-containing protein n=1 Tax=Theileria parva TaxID=5875 RepID=Q4N026_THEPA|nr:Ribosomal protein L7/L12 domain protein [Theileria parva strain Muguga]EAN31063.1 Ribosomal protein L7/L12 domain protein [Theileria parva strain Muguga]|eukprot:XP_763346.1 hypothetical protein [Theileria parva strain Muguga]
MFFYSTKILNFILAIFYTFIADTYQCHGIRLGTIPTPGIRITSPLARITSPGIRMGKIMFINKGCIKPYSINITSNFLVKSSKVDEILENLKTLTLLETSELVRKIEEVFGVSAQPVGPLTLQPQSTAPTEEYQDEEPDDTKERERDKKRKLNVVIKEILKEKRINAYNKIKEYYPNKSATEIKKIMDALPHVVKTVTSRREGEEIIQKLSIEGMTVDFE